ncbi:MAG: hypothetical protein ABI634_11260 [Acidobacteriota bacterium]
MPLRMPLIVLLVLVLTSGCRAGSKGSPTGPDDPAGSLAFTVAPIDPALLQYIVPLGNMGPWAHTFPTDHAYFYHHLGAGSFAPVTILAPAAGVIENTYPGLNGEVKVWVRVTSQYTYYFDHVILSPGLNTGTRIDAGSVVGVSGGAAFDFAVRDMNLNLPFVIPARYGMDTVHAQSPLKYFVEPLRSQFYAKVQRDGGDLDGRVSYDQDGTLSGNWFAEDLPVSGSTANDISVGQRQIAFARDVRAPDRQRVSIGGFNFTGLYGVPSDAPDFAAITPASGAIVYRLLEAGEPGGPAGTRQVGLLLAQLLDARRLRLEVVPDQLAAGASFSAAAATYVR